jgi:hypothetical protein
VDLDAIDEGHKSAPRKTTTAAAAQYFNWLSQTAESSGVSVDVFAVGSASVNVAQLAVVAQKSGGLLSLQEGAPHQLDCALPVNPHRRLSAAPLYVA